MCVLSSRLFRGPGDVLHSRQRCPLIALTGVSIRKQGEFCVLYILSVCKKSTWFLKGKHCNFSNKFINIVTSNLAQAASGELQTSYFLLKLMRRHLLNLGGDESGQAVQARVARLATQLAG